MESHYSKFKLEYCTRVFLRHVQTISATCTQREFLLLCNVCHGNKYAVLTGGIQLGL